MNTVECSFNKEVLCRPNKRHCSTCGWNPEVAKSRLEKITQQNKGGTQIAKTG